MEALLSENEEDERVLLERELSAVLIKFCRHNFAFNDSIYFVGRLIFTLDQLRKVELLLTQYVVADDKSSIPHFDSSGHSTVSFNNIADALNNEPRVGLQRVNKACRFNKDAHAGISRRGGSVDIKSEVGESEGDTRIETGPDKSTPVLSSTLEVHGEADAAALSVNLRRVARKQKKIVNKKGKSLGKMKKSNKKKKKGTTRRKKSNQHATDPSDLELCDTATDDDDGELGIHLRNLDTPSYGSPDPTFAGKTRASKRKEMADGATEESRTHVASDAVIEKRFHACVQCERKFTSSGHLARHSRLAHDSGRTSCGSKVDVEKENDEEPRGGKRKLSCSQCARKFTSTGHLAHHTRVSHDSARTEQEERVDVEKDNDYVPQEGKRKLIVSCSQCARNFSSAGRLAQHSRVVHESERTAQEEADLEKQDLAQICEQGGSPQLTSQNIKALQDNPQKMEDGLQSVLQDSLSSLANMGAEGAAQKLVCGVCRRTFKYHRSFKRHKLDHAEGRIKATSPGFSYRCVCSVCGKLCKTPEGAQRHERKHALGNKRPHKSAAVFMCDICGAGFSYRSLLTRHSVRHSTVRNYACDECPLTFKLPRSLRLHRAVHNPFNVHTCGICSESFRSRHFLKVHKAHHHITSVCAMHACNLCAREFHERWRLARHVNTVHLNKPGYACRFCTAVYNRADNLTAHMKTHSIAIVSNVSVAD